LSNGRRVKGGKKEDGRTAHGSRPGQKDKDEKVGRWGKAEGEKGRGIRGFGILTFKSLRAGIKQRSYILGHFSPPPKQQPGKALFPRYTSRWP